MVKTVIVRSTPQLCRMVARIRIACGAITRVGHSWRCKGRHVGQRIAAPSGDGRLLSLRRHRLTHCHHTREETGAPAHWLIQAWVLLAESGHVFFSARLFNCARPPFFVSWQIELVSNGVCRWFFQTLNSMPSRFKQVNYGDCYSAWLGLLLYHS